MELSETGFYEPYRALLKLTTQLDGLSYYTRVWQGTIGSIFGVPRVPYGALESIYLGLSESKKNNKVSWIKN